MQHRLFPIRSLVRASVALPSALALTLAACAVGPNYHRPGTPPTTVYREAQDWKPATPSQIAANTPWWSIYNDAQLDALERQIDVSNQTLKAAEASYRAARAAVGIDRGSLFPSVNLSGSYSRSGGGQGAGGSGNRGSYSAGASADWQLDVWGRIRRTLEGDVARAQASAADIAAARLSAQSTLAENYFQLRAADEQKRLLDASIDAFKTSLQIAQNRVAAGVATVADVYTAQTQLDNTQAQAVNVQLTRAKLEHAMAVLMGRPPSDFRLTAAAFPATVPVIPAGIPSELLQRRPDISASERSVAAANAQVGVATAAWFPSLTLTGSYGFTGAALSGLFSAGNSIWSLGPQLAETLFNGGARIAQNQQARASYDVAVANYRQTVLAAFQQVEDNLASLRVLQEQSVLQNSGVLDARRSETLTLNQYKAGVADYASVITAQTTRLNSEISLLSIQSQRLVASVDLVAALGGNWSDAQLPQPGALYSLDKNPPTPPIGPAPTPAPVNTPPP